MHGIFSNSSRTSLRNTEQYYRDRGYQIHYIDYNTITEDPTYRIHQLTSSLSGDKIVIGHSLGGRYVSKASMNKMEDTSYYTVNSPFASSQDFAKDLHRFGDWTSLLLFLTDFEAYMESEKDIQWGLGHSVDEDQVVI